MKWGEKTADQIVYVYKNINKALLGRPAIKNLDIMTFNRTDDYSCGEVTENQQNPARNNTENITAQYPEIFKGLGKVKGDPITIKLKDDTTPYRLTAPRHIPIPLYDAVHQEIQQMEKLGVIKKIDEPTEWCHPIVIVPKPNGSIRLCIDLTKLNQGIQRELYQLESVDETIAKIGNECIVMSKLDANSGYWQIPLDENSQRYTAFITPFGRYCCTRGPFGMNSMQEIFNKKMDIIIEGLQGGSQKYR